MIIYNTTFHAATTVEQEFLAWMKGFYIPEALKGGILKDPQFSLIMARQEGDNGNSYSLQFKAGSVSDLERWYGAAGAELVEAMGKKFGQNVAGFSTIMSVIDL